MIVCVCVCVYVYVCVDTHTLFPILEIPIRVELDVDATEAVETLNKFSE